MDDGEGVYFPSAEAYPQERPGPRRLKKAAVGLVGLAAVLGGASFAVTTLLTRPSTHSQTREPAALAPSRAVRTETARPTRSPATPAPQLIPGTLGAARQLSRPSPTPSLPPSMPGPVSMSDGEMASAQVSRLVQTPSPAPSGLTAATAPGPVTVATETGSDGSDIRVVSAHYDVTAHRESLLAADSGERTGRARCTQKFTEAGAPPLIRPGLLLCWRATADKSVVTVAVAPTGSVPARDASIEAVDRAWLALS